VAVDYVCSHYMRVGSMGGCDIDESPAIKRACSWTPGLNNVPKCGYYAMPAPPPRCDRGCVQFRALRSYTRGYAARYGVCRRHPVGGGGGVGHGGLRIVESERSFCQRGESRAVQNGLAL